MQNTLKVAIDEIRLVPITEIEPDPRALRDHGETIEQVKSSLQRYGFAKPIVVYKGRVVAGHALYEAATQLGLAEVPVYTPKRLDGTDWSDLDAREYRIVDNQVGQQTQWVLPELRVEIGELKKLGTDLNSLGFDKIDITAIMRDHQVHSKAGALAEKFGVPPVSVLNAREGWWRERKQAWTSLGIKSELGRGEVQAALMSARATQANVKAEKVGKAKDNAWVTTSVFDPVLTELAYRWFCPEGGVVLDPFAGGSVRGVVAAKLGRPYHGGELRAEQVEANRAQWVEIAQHRAMEGADEPHWYVGDSRKIDATMPKGFEADFLFTCPPYADLEVYSNDPADISNMDYAEFMEAYREIIAKSAALLKADRFAAIVVGDLRDKKGIMRGFIADTIRAAEAAGLQFYNEAILLTSMGTASIRASRQFTGARKLVRVHQNMLVFLKGDAKRATQALGSCEFGSISE